MTKFHASRPETPRELEEYFDLRWRILRAPWDQPRGSEKDEFEDVAEHITIRSEDDRLLGVGRLHRLNAEEAQVRYMAVDEVYRGQGAGIAIYQHLENFAIETGIKRITVNARISAVRFYKRLGFNITGDGPILFEEIQHKVMQKQL